MAKNRSEGSNRSRSGGSRSNESVFRGWSDTARERPLASAAVAAAAVGAGVFLWSRRNQISDQLSNLSDQISDWTENMRSGQQQGSEFEPAGTESSGSAMATGVGGSSAIGGGSTGTRSTTTGRGSTGRSTTGRGGRSGRTTGMSETGGGNASLGAHSGTTGSGAGNP